MLRKLGAAASAAFLISSAAGSAYALSPLPGLVNQNFTMYTGSAPKNCFTCVDPVGWTGGSGLIFIDSTASFNQSAAGPVYLTTYGNPTGAYSGNYVEADGNPTFESGFNYTVTGLTPGQSYSLSFYQGASSQAGFGYNSWKGMNTGTTNQWIVSLGTSGLQLKGGGPVDPEFGPTDLYYNPDTSASVVASPLMTVPYKGTVGWQYVTLTLTADAPTDLLSFLAWGDNGSTVNLPPIAFLAGVDSPPGLGAGGVPEPSTWAMMLLGLLGLGWAVRSHRKSTARRLEGSAAA